jgi:hypothetical protein
MDDAKRRRLIRRLAGGSDPAPKSIRDAAIRIMIGFSDKEDEQMVNEYLESLYD